jgi:pyridinium-3,5-bisthiocarboxylic acid mononucleotide nickel chelatase
MIAYLDLPAGISGDMFLGCLVDAGWDVARLRAVIEKLKLPAGAWEIEARQVMKGALRATLVDVKTPKVEAAQSQGIAIPHKSVEQRNLGDIRRIVESAELPEMVKAQAMAVFVRLANAEAKVHGMKVEEIHFHEVGAIDSIIDIVGAVAGLNELGIEKLYASAFPMSGGWTSAAHGQLPLPAPATLELIAEAEAPTREGPGDGELVTPTGAALVCALATFQRPAMKLTGIATGAGQRNTRWPNVARLLLGSDARDERAKTLVQMETNIDDMNPQFYPAVMEKLLAAGALDAWIVPVQMKKGRPGAVVSVLCESELEPAMRDILLKHTTTLGVRVHEVRRHEARREMRQVSTAYGNVTVKVKWVGDEIAGTMPEYEECRKIAESKGIPVQQVYEAAVAAAHEIDL